MTGTSHTLHGLASASDCYSVVDMPHELLIRAPSSPRPKTSKTD